MLISLVRTYLAGPGDACGIHAGFLWEIADMGGYICILVHVGSQHPGYAGEGVMLTSRFLDHWYDAERIAASGSEHGSRLVKVPDIVENDTLQGLCITATRFYDETLHIPRQSPDYYWRWPSRPFRGFLYAMTLCCKLCEFAAACQEESSRGQYAYFVR